MDRCDRASSTGLPEYMPQLDGLRAVAVLMVFVSHWVPWPYQLSFPWGNFGVDMFFVISGLLITDILLRARRFIEQGNQGLPFTLRQFYVRRFLRIFPLYYAFLLAYAMAAESPVNQLTPWLWTYTINLYRVFVDVNWEGPISHVWSLSVEEQFYLVWPWVILLAPKRLLLPVLLLFCVIGPATKIILAMQGVSERPIRFFTLSRFDPLAIGGVLAYLIHQRGLPTIANSRVAAGLLWTGAPLFLLVVGLRIFGIGSTNWMILELTSETLLCGWVVLQAAHGLRGVVGSVLASGPMVYLGRISFGLYLLHKPIPLVLRELGFELGGPWGVNLFLFTAIAILVASVSWYAFERPIIRLKRHFPYRQNPVSNVGGQPMLAAVMKDR